MFFEDLEFLEMRCLAKKIWSGAVFLGSGAAWSHTKHTLRLTTTIDSIR